MVSICIFSIQYWFQAFYLCKSYVYWTVHHFDSWRIRDQLDVNSYYVLFHFFYAQHVSDINTSIIMNLRLFYCIATLVVCCCFDMCWSFGVAWLGLYLCSMLKYNCYTDTTSTQPHRNSNTHPNKNTRPMWWYNRKVTGFWWWIY